MDLSNVFDNFSDSMNSERMSRVAEIAIGFAILWFWTMITIFAIGGTFGTLFFFIGLGVYIYYKIRKKKKASKLHSELMELSVGERRLSFELFLVEDFVVVDLGDIQLAADIKYREEMRIMIQDLFKLIREVRETGTAMDEKLESEVMAEYLLGLGVSPSAGRDKVKSEVCTCLNKLYEMGYLSEGMFDQELVLAVQSQADNKDMGVYESGAIRRIMKDIEKEAVIELHKDSPKIDIVDG